MFPFHSDPEVLSLAAARDFSAVSHLVTKCFTGVSSLVIQTRGVNPSSGAEAEPSERTFIAAVEGPQGEALTLNRLLGTVRIPARVDRWMGRLLDVVRKTLAAQTKEVSGQILPILFGISWFEPFQPVNA